jgi:flagellar FliJ protein
MRRFVFKLEGVLDQRRQVEQQRQRDLAEAQMQILTIEKELNRASEMQEASPVVLRGRVDPRALAVQVRFAQVMGQKLSKLRALLAEAREDLATAQAALIEASKQRKVLEKLQEKQQARFLVEEQRLESSAHDDVTQHMTRDNPSTSGSFPPLAS